ncbi:MAG: 16S rRNA (guanine(527)-N(7))-methyltransferase RsmG [Candidatus Dormibacteria bacterium]
MRLRRYLDLLLERNRVLNLTAVRDPAEAWPRLVLASLSLLDAHQWRGDERVADIGSGGGLPGIPLKIALPGIHITLVDSDQKKSEFLRHVAKELNLDGVLVEARRAEEIGHDPAHRGTYDVVVTRAAAKAPVTAEYCIPLLRVGGLMLAQAKAEDFRAAARALGQLGASMRAYRAGVVVVGKGRPTPEIYPRRVGLPAKKPL